MHVHMSDDDNGKRKKGTILSFGSDLYKKFSTRTDVFQRLKFSSGF